MAKADPNAIIYTPEQNEVEKKREAQAEKDNASVPVDNPTAYYHEQLKIAQEDLAKEKEANAKPAAPKEAKK